MKILVIGAGVAGLFFASFMENKKVQVLDKNEFSGRKLLATGNGRCNFTNLNNNPSFYYSNNEGFVDFALENFSQKDLIDYFYNLGIPSTNLPSGRCYPLTFSAKTVRDGLFLEAYPKADFVFNEEVKSVDFDKKKVSTYDKSFHYDKLIIATGGKTLANSGSDGKIFDLIKDKIPITDLTFGISNYKSKQRFSKKAKGTKITGTASLIVDGNVVIDSTDDIIFQDYGLTGTAILDISNDLSLALLGKKKCQIEVDFFPSFSKNDFENYLQNIIGRYPNRTVFEFLIGIINEKLIEDICKLSKISPDKKLKSLNQKDIKMLIKSLKNLRFDVSDIHDKTNAQVTLGGVDTTYINPKTFASTIYPDVHFIGEVLDVAGACGGYNIQWAASSAKACADYLRSLDV